LSGDFGTGVLRKIQALEKEGIVLTIAQKLLLAETGTVEQVLRMLTGSPVHVRVIGQSEEKGIIRRKVMLLSDSGEVLIKASSKIYCRNLPPAVIEKIRRKKAGIGTIISDSDLEVFRKITKMGVKDGMPYRKYRISYRKKIAFEINEEILLKGGPGGI
jgi:chorismate-pyruvate lyase